MARPTDYTPELAARLCERISEIGSLHGALTGEGSEDLPAERTVYRWLVKHEEFRQAYTRTREIADEPMAEEMLRLANDDSVPADQKRIMVDVMKWQLARRSAKKWGDRQVIAGDPDAPLVSATEDQIDARINALLKTALDANPAGGDSE
jgi:hypothetical protein